MLTNQWVFAARSTQAPLVVTEPERATEEPEFVTQSGRGFYVFWQKLSQHFEQHTFASVRIRPQYQIWIVFFLWKH